MENSEKPKPAANNFTPNVEDVTIVANEKKEALRPNAETEYVVLGLLMSAPNLENNEDLLQWNSMFEMAFKDADQVDAISRAIDNDISRRVTEWDIDNGISDISSKGFLDNLRVKGYFEESDSGNQLVEKTKDRGLSLLWTEMSFANQRWIIAREYMYQSEKSYRARTQLKKEIEDGAK